MNPGYAWHRLRLAAEAARAHPDPSARARALVKVGQWNLVIEGMASGALSHGTRQPIAAPVWVTPEVVHGGFATGRMLAEAPLRDDERSLLGDGEADREQLNRWFLSDAGQERLRAALADGTWRIDLPEEGALLVVTWLLDHDPAAALDLIAQLRPWFDRLRFGPRFVDTRGRSGASVHVATAHEVAAGLRSQETPEPLVTMNAVLGVWNPLYDRLVALWSEVGDGPLPEGWASRRDAILRDHDAAAAKVPMGRYRKAGSNYQRLLAAARATPGRWTRDQLAAVRSALANTVAHTGGPGSEQRLALRAEQARMAARPTFDRLRRVVADRLEKLAPDVGVDAVEPFVRAIEPAESEALAGVAIPEAVGRKVRRALDAPVAELVQLGVIGSGEVLGRVLPQITHQIAAASIADRVLRELFGAIYSAFRRRRSLLLLDLQHQVTLEELPWIRAVQGFRKSHADAPVEARHALEQVTLLVFRAFPQTLLPNPLVRELGALATAAGMKLPLVEEVAADIFMGTFTTKWTDAARVASRFLEGTLYARYYDLPPESAWSTEGAFDRLCEERAREAGRGSGRTTAESGAVLEQSQILTTQNLAVLIDALDLRAELAALGPTLATDAFAWVVRKRLPKLHLPRLKAVKNGAYAWRQGIFWMSLCSPAEQRAILEELVATSAANPESAQRLGPAIAGLGAVLEGATFTASGRCRGDGKRWFGWSVGPHWMLAGDAPPG